MDFKNLTLDKFQEEAVNAIEQNKSVVVSAPTGSGKTLIADYIIDRELAQGKRVIYTAPIKALSNQKYKDFCSQFGDDAIGLVTGDTVKNQTAPILIMTTEIYRNMAIANDQTLEKVSYLVFDEIHYINDIERGSVWEEAIIFTPPHIRMLCLSATIPNAEEFASWISAIKEHAVQVVRHDIRPIPLHISFFDTELGITTLKNLRDVADIPDYEYLRGKSRNRRQKLPPPSHVELIKNIKHNTPSLYFCFSRGLCEQKAQELSRKNIFSPNPKISNFIREKLSNAPKEISQLESTRKLRTILPLGIGFHHAGLLPIMKDIVEELFGQGLISVLYTTETFAVGINMPAKAVCFDSLRKFDGISFRMINSKEFFQIAGRAGRRGIDKEGFVHICIDRKDFDYGKIKNLTEKDLTPIISQFRLSVNTVLNLVKSHNETEINEILCKSFDSFQKYGYKFAKKQNFKSHQAFENLVNKLEKLGYIKDDELTEKGIFASNISSDEILIGEIFGTDFVHGLSPHQILLIIACICIEDKRILFHKTYTNRLTDVLIDKIRRNSYIRTDWRFENMENVTALIEPCMKGESIFDFMQNTSMTEGDLVRYFRQILDKVRQVKTATNEKMLKDILEECQDKISSTLSDVDVV